MNRKLSLCLVAAAGLLSLNAGDTLQAQQNPITFFVTSVGPGDGANLGGLAGADNHCQFLASTVGAGNRTWRAYLSTVGVGSAAGVNARNRIGQGPSQNARGVVIANT